MVRDVSIFPPVVAGLQQWLQSTTRDVVRVEKNDKEWVDVDGSFVVAANSVW